VSDALSRCAALGVVCEAWLMRYASSEKLHEVSLIQRDAADAADKG
jgi:hypothetical protein